MFNINLIPWRAEQRQLRYCYLGLSITLAIILVSAGFWGADYFFKNSIADIEQKTKALEKDLLRLKKQEALEKEKIRKIEMIKSANFIMKTIKLNNKKIYKKMTKLISQVPDTIRLLELNLSDEKWSFQGLAADKDILFAFSKKVIVLELLNHYHVKKWEVRDEGINFLFNEEN